MPERDINIIKEYQKEREKFEALSLEKKGTEVERLKEEAQLENAPSFYDKLEDGGYLLLGHAESMMNISTAYTLQHLKNDMVYRKPFKEIRNAEFLTVSR